MADKSKEESPKTCFVIMPFSKEMQPIYDRIYEPVIRSCGLEPVRIDSIFRAGLITKDIFDGIGNAEIVLADLTEANPNVYYELGIAHRERKPVILTAQHIEQDIRFDVKALRCIEYNPGQDVFWNDKLRDDLKRAISETLAEPLSSIATPWLGLVVEQKGSHVKSEEVPEQLSKILDVVTSLHAQIARQPSFKMLESKFLEERSVLMRRLQEMETRFAEQQMLLQKLKEHNSYLDFELKDRRDSNRLDDVIKNANAS